MISRRQLLELGYSADAIRHRLGVGRLHRVARGVYSVGRRDLTRCGRWMAAVLACGEGAVLSHSSAAALWRIGRERRRTIELSLTIPTCLSRAGLTLHRRTALTAADLTTHHGIPVTTPTCTLIDLAAQVGRDAMEALVNDAVRLDLTDPDSLLAALADTAARPGVGALRGLLDRNTFRLTDSQLERWFLPIARRAGLPTPLTGEYVNGFKVDFHWPDLGLVVETDGLRFHRTPEQQLRDRRRDQAHTAAGLTQLRFAHFQIRYEPASVEEILAATARRLAAQSGYAGGAPG